MQSNKWLRITIASDPVLLEPICDFLVGVLEAGVETNARDEPNFGTLTCYVPKANPSEREVAEIIATISSHLLELATIFSVPPPVLTPSLYDEEDWSATWKKHFKPFAIVPGLVITPSWEEYRPHPGEAVITMDPGMAFGTGHHATTSLCLQLLRRILTQGSSMHVLDVGTGTGILGMAAILFGAASATCIDNDPEAVSAASDNVRRNKLDGKIAVRPTPLNELSLQYQIVVANIVHDVLIALAADLTRLTEQGGSLILSGIIVGEQVAGIKTCFVGLGFTLVSTEERKEWAALHFRKS